MRPTISLRFEAGNSLGTRDAQRSQVIATRIFAMTINEAHANPTTVSGTMIVFNTPT